MGVIPAELSVVLSDTKCSVRQKVNKGKNTGNTSQRTDNYSALGNVFPTNPGRKERHRGYGLFISIYKPERAGPDSKNPVNPAEFPEICGRSE
jgi:hypothetical protein